MKRACFDAIKENKFFSRATRIARGTFGLNALRKSFSALRNFTIKQKLLQVGYREMITMKKHRCFNKWLTEYDKCVKGREANAIINFDRAHLIMIAWKRVVHNAKLVRQFRGETYERRLKLFAIESLKQNVVEEGYQRLVFKSVKNRSDAELMRDAFTGLSAAVRLKKIQANMARYYLHKF